LFTDGTNTPSLQAGSSGVVTKHAGNAITSRRAPQSPAYTYRNFAYDNFTCTASPPANDGSVDDESGAVVGASDGVGLAESEADAPDEGDPDEDPDAVSDGVPDDVPVGVSEVVPEGVSDGVLDAVPDGESGGVVLGAAELPDAVGV
jgi:hypothetical protein